MSRPIYVTKRDRDNEAKALEKFVAWMNKSFGTLCGTYSGQLAPEMSPFDWIILRNGEKVGVVEYKRRKGWSTQYNFWHIAKKKIEAVKDAAYGLQKVLAFEWDDGLFIANFARFGETHETTGGRLDRNDAADIETMVNISRTSFTRVT